jgi:hypothetical protein
MNALKMMVVRGWPAIVISALAVVGYYYEWPIAVLGTVLGVILVIGLAVAVVSAREKELEQSAQRLRQLAGYFSRRFMGDSSLSIFAIINSLFKVDDPRLWDWARACDMSQRIFNTWSDAFTSRLEADTRTGRFAIYLRTYLNEIWMMTSLYHEYIEQFSEIAGKVAVPQETLEQYHKFAVEYNTFVEQFRDAISELKKVARTEIEPPSVKMAHELTGIPIAEEKK